MTALALEKAVERAPPWCAPLSFRGREWSVPEKVDGPLPPGVPAQAAMVARRRGIGDLAAYFRPSLQASMPDPNALPDMPDAVALLCGAVEAGSSIGIVGDYDVDGATSVALLLRWLRLLGRDAVFDIPDRMAEGYGVSVAGVERLHAAGVRLLIVADSGTNAVGPLARARELGMTPLVLDHHDPGSELPAGPLVNPKIDDGRPFDYLCSAGIVFLLLVGANRELDRRGFFRAVDKPDLRTLLGLVALGTVADVVPLVGLNRAYVATGVARMDEICGMRALARATGQAEYAVSALGFVFGPCINAGGRIGDARMGAQLLSSDDPAECDRLATALAEVNRERQQMQKTMLDRAVEMAAPQAGEPLILVCDPAWHPGLVGLVAGRLRELYDRPAVVVGDLGRGSCRSTEGFDVGAAIVAARERGLLLAGGGHPMAAGFTVELRRLDDLRAFLLPRAAAAPRPPVKVDVAVPAGGLSVELVEALRLLAPFGAGNPGARIAVYGGVARRIFEIKGRHLKFFLKGAQGESQAILFNGIGTPFGEALRRCEGCAVDMLGTATVDVYGGVATATLKPEDAVIGVRS